MFRLFDEYFWIFIFIYFHDNFLVFYINVSYFIQSFISLDVISSYVFLRVVLNNLQRVTSPEGKQS